MLANIWLFPDPIEFPLVSTRERTKSRSLIIFFYSAEWEELWAINTWDSFQSGAFFVCINGDENWKLWVEGLSEREMEPTHFAPEIWRKLFIV